MKTDPLRTPPYFWMRVVLQITVALQCLGFAVWMLRFEALGGTPLFKWLSGQMEAGGLAWDPTTSRYIQIALGICLLALGLMSLFRPRVYPILSIAVFQILFAGILWRFQIGYWPWLALPSHAIRITAPIALALLVASGRSVHLTPSQQWAAVLLRWGIASTFLAHGAKAFSLSPTFHGLIAASACARLDCLEPQVIDSILRVIGAMDMVCAVSLLFVRWRWLLVWLAFWGGVTAMSRIVAGGFDLHAHDVLTRSAHAGAPIALGLYWWVGKSRSCPS